MPPLPCLGSVARPNADVRAKSAKAVAQCRRCVYSPSLHQKEPAMAHKDIASTDAATLPHEKQRAKKEHARDRVRLSKDEQIERNIANMQRIAHGDKESVSDFLKRAGILDKAGKMPAAML